VWHCPWEASSPWTVSANRGQVGQTRLPFKPVIVSLAASALAVLNSGQLQTES
jgi:hypothetical protein